MIATGYAILDTLDLVGMLMPLCWPSIYLTSLLSSQSIFQLSYSRERYGSSSGRVKSEQGDDHVDARSVMDFDRVRHFVREPTNRLQDTCPERLWSPQSPILDHALILEFCCYMVGISKPHRMRWLPGLWVQDWCCAIE